MKLTVHRSEDAGANTRSYDADAKLDWHGHPGGQVLLITDRTGYHQEKGKPAQIVHKGDAIKFSPDVGHLGAALPTPPSCPTADIGTSMTVQGRFTNIYSAGGAINATLGLVKQ